LASQTKKNQTSTHPHELPQGGLNDHVIHINIYFALFLGNKTPAFATIYVSLKMLKYIPTAIFAIAAVATFAGLVPAPMLFGLSHSSAGILLLFGAWLLAPRPSGTGIPSWMRDQAAHK
jgi:hypothetical protein